MRIFHTADWHLGHTLHGVPRAFEHQQFLSWLLEQLKQRQPDALLIAGDIFDSSNPPASAQAQYYQFLLAARQVLANLDIIIIAGNHDSAARLDAPAPLLKALNVHVIGSLPDNLDDLLIPLTNSAGERAAWCAAVPFLRPVDLPQRDDLVSGVRTVYQTVLEAASTKIDNGEALITTGHCYLTGSALSELSERKILGGNQHALPADIFPENLVYTALGHLHLPQSVAKRDNLRYSGSPIPLSMSEANYPHQILEFDVMTGQLESLKIPRAVDMIRLPARPLVDIKEELETREWLDLPPEQWPFIEVEVLLDKPEPGLRAELEEALKNKAARLVKITPHYSGAGATLADATPRANLHELKPEQVFIQRYQSQYDAEPETALLNAFHALMEGIEQ
jgi:exonuclease SbcD